jgi:hypothetical protein
MRLFVLQMDEGADLSADRSVKRVVRDLSRIEKEFFHIVRTLPQGEFLFFGRI